MKLLIFTQKVDQYDTTLGFFHTWLKEFSKSCETVHVICLSEGSHSLPDNVSIFSLGKDKKDPKDSSTFVSKLEYMRNVYAYLSHLSGTYDHVFVHMNQEYVVLSGIYWKIKNIPVYLWRNHPYGNILTRIAVSLSTKVFCTSTQSFTARYKKTEIMPVGVDMSVFAPVPGVMRKKYSVCMVGRIAPVKHIELALEAVSGIVLSGGQISLSIIGSPLPKDTEYYENLKKYVVDNNLGSYVVFVDAVPPMKLPEIYSGHEICLNLTTEGSFDKTIVEAAACGAIPVVASEGLSGLLPEACITNSEPRTIAVSLQQALVAATQLEIAKELESFVKSQSLDALFTKLIKSLS